MSTRASPLRRGRRLALPALVALALAGCPKPKPDAPPPLVVSAPVATPPAGRVQDGTFVDSRWPLIVPVPEGWTAQVGDDGDEERLVLSDPEGDVRVTVAATPGGELAPRPLPGCAWTFADRARYRAVKVRDAVLVATCTPEDANAPRVLAYVIPQEGVNFHVEARIPTGHLRAGRADMDTVVGGVRFR